MKRILLLLTLLWAVPSYAAITFDAGSSTARVSGVGSVTLSHTTANQPNRVLIVFCALNGDSGSPTVTGVTYNSVAMASIASVGTSTGDNTYARAWKLAAPATGANDVVATFSATIDGSGFCSAETWYDVDQTTINRAASSQVPGTNSSSLTPTSSSADMVLDVIAWRYAGQVPLIGASQTERVTISTSAPTCCVLKGSSEPNSGSSPIMSWTWDVGITDAAHIAFALIPAAAATAIPVLMHHYTQLRRK